MLLFVVFSITPQLGMSNEQAATEAEIRAIERDIQHSRKLLESLNAERSSAQNQIQKNEKAIHQLNKDISKLEARLSEGQGEIKSSRDVRSN